MKKQRKENPALAALATKLGAARLQTAPPPQHLHEHGDSSFVESRGDGEPQQQGHPAAHDHEASAGSGGQVETFTILKNRNPTDNNSLETSYPIVNSGFKAYVGQVVEVPVEMLRVEDNVRAQVIEDDKFGGLVGTIRDIGVLQDLLVQLTVLPDGVEDLLIVAGQRRWVAAGRAGKRTVPCKIVEGLDRKKRILYGLIENVVREELSTIELAFAYRELVEKEGMTKDELAQVIGCSKKTIQRYVNLTAWPQAAIDMLRQSPGLFSTDFLFNGISGDILSDPDLLVLRLRKRVDQANDSAGDQTNPQNPKPLKVSDVEITKWNQAARQNLGVPVRMSGTRDNLRITIRCSGDENVKKVLEKLGIGAD
jgi:ParB/RepB/Spo0J family partition protein